MSRLAFFATLLTAAAAAVVDPLAAFGYDASAELSRVDLTGKEGIVKIVRPWMRALLRPPAAPPQLRP